ncbi:MULTISPECIES: DUF6087 family protein [Streptomyces]|uniref:DUF6087 family protein n=1 Tax=Streptomyces TaxID=1883 RepID=UPI000A97CE42
MSSEPPRPHDDSGDSLEHVAARHDHARQRMVGRLRAVVLALGPVRAAHLYPEAPRLILRHDGYQWTPLTTAADYASAQQLLHGQVEQRDSAWVWLFLSDIGVRPWARIDAGQLGSSVDVRRRGGATSRRRGRRLRRRRGV